MAVQIEVNPNTVMRTYDFLQSKEIICNKRGVGFFVATDGKQKATDFRKDEFLQNELPKVFKTAALLKISFEELKEKYSSQNKDLPNQ
jgi:GntR family transcriptional regulator